ncbi:MAG: glycosyltransferase family 4 protein, partial [Balneolales bacterium]|nr:glycosyltransferase family 4 protein [Balneolales bacterium]
VGGMQRVSMQLVSELKKRADVDVKNIIQHAPWKGIELRTALFLGHLTRKLPGIAADYNADIILFSSMATASLAKLTRNRIDIPMVTINHGHDVKLSFPPYQRFVPHVFEALDGVISVSSATRQECINRGMDPEKGIALPNGFDYQHLQETPDKQISRSHLEEVFGIDLSNKKLLLTVGRQVKRKGHEWFLKEILPKINSDILYLAIGDGPEHEKLLEVWQNHAQKDQILLIGKQPDEILQQAYAAADVFIMPNIPVAGDMEGFGIVLLEANLASTPAVASDLEGIKDVITNGENGHKIPVKDSDTFAQKIDQVLNEDYEVLSANTRKFVEQNFGWDKVADQYISYLGEVIKKYKNSTR